MTSGTLCVEWILSTRNHQGAEAGHATFRTSARHDNYADNANNDDDEYGDDDDNADENDDV